MSKPSVTASTVNLSLNPPTEESSSDEKLPKRRTPLLLGPDEPFMAAEIAASINASTLALINASIPLRATVVAVSLAVLEMDDALRSRNISPTRVPYRYVSLLTSAYWLTRLQKRKELQEAVMYLLLLFLDTTPWTLAAPVTQPLSWCIVSAQET